MHEDGIYMEYDKTAAGTAVFNFCSMHHHSYHHIGSRRFPIDIFPFLLNRV